MVIFRRIWTLLIILVVTEGSIRKWILPEYSTEVYILKDVIIIAMLFVLALNPQWQLFHYCIFPKWRRSAARAMLIVYILVCCVEVFNPALPSIWLGLFGLKSHILYSS